MKEVIYDGVGVGNQQYAISSVPPLC